MRGWPALSLFHLGPGFANSLANQHNARRHHSPMVNVIGDQASWHLAADAPLTSDIDLLTAWTGRTQRIMSADECGQAMADAITSAIVDRQSISNVILPADFAWSETTVEPTSVEPAPIPSIDTEAIVDAARALRRTGSVLILDASVISDESVRLAAAIAAATGCKVRNTRTGRQEIGRSLPPLDELPYFPVPLRAELADTSVAVITGRGEPVTFFGYPDVPSLVLPDSAERIVIGDLDDKLDDLLLALADELGVVTPDGSSAAGSSGAPDLPPVDPGPLSPRNLGQAFARAVPELGIVVGESISSGGGYRRRRRPAAPHTLLSVIGGAIGGGLPAAVGAAVACPDRPVLALQADGASLYTIQSLWTMARESLDVTTVICANRRYQILDIELQAADIELTSSVGGLTDLSNPTMDFVKIVEGFGVPESVGTGAELERALERAVAEPGPHLIEARL